MANPNRTTEGAIYNVRGMDEARELTRAYKAGEIKDEFQGPVIRGLERFRQRMMSIQQAKAEGRGVIDNATVSEEDAGLAAYWDALKRSGRGVREGLLTILSSAASEPFIGAGGLAVAVGTAVSNRSIDKGMNEAANWIRDAREALTLTPQTDEGQDFLQMIAAPLKKLDDGADYVASKLSGGNPLAATLIYSSLIGAADLFGLKGARAARLGANYTRTLAAADRLGINLRNRNGFRIPDAVPGIGGKTVGRQGFVTGEQVGGGAARRLPDEVVRAAARMSPETRHANASILRQELLDVEFRHRKAVKQSEGQAMAQSAQINSKNVNQFARDAEAILRNEFSIDQMPIVRGHLKSLQKLSERPKIQPKSSLIEVPKGFETRAARQAPPHMAEMADLQKLRNSIERSLFSKKTKSKRNPNIEDFEIANSADQRVALRNLQRQMDDFMDQQFNTDMIDGGPEAIASWRDATELRKHYNERFNSNVALRQLMDREASPEALSRWLLSADAATGGFKAVPVINKLIEVLGKDSAAVRGIKQSITYDLVKPLLQPKKNFGKVVTNIDKFLREQTSLIKVLDFDTGNLRTMQSFAQTVTHLVEPVPLVSINGAIKNTARLLWGHGIAKAGVKVNIGTNVLGLVSRAGDIRGKALVHGVSGALWGSPAIPKTTIAAGYVYAAAVRAELDSFGIDLDDNWIDNALPKPTLKDNAKEDTF